METRSGLVRRRPAPPPRSSGGPWVLAVALAVAVLTAGCSALSDDAVATWDLAAGQSLGVGTSTFTAMVTRLGCNNGVTGTANDPDVAVTDDLVVVTFTVSPGQPGAASCPGNNEVAYEVRLPEALGARSLLDGPPARATEVCQPRVELGNCRRPANRWAPVKSVGRT